MKDKFQAHLQRWQWTLGYRFAALSPKAKLLLIGTLVAHALLLALLVSSEKQYRDLQQTLNNSQAVQVSAGQDNQSERREMLTRFQAFLPAPETAGATTDSLHQAAHEAGISLERLVSQRLDGQHSAIVQRQVLRLQVQGEQSKVERFILLSLLENDALLLRRWSYQAGTTTSAASTLDFELLLKP
jgi:hypothetical protein